MTFSELAGVFQQLEKTASRNTMTEILAKLFHRSSAQEIGNICYLLQGRVVPLYETIEFGIAEKLMIRAIALAYRVDEKKVHALFKKYGDVGTVAEHCYQVPLSILQQDRHDGKNTVLSVHDVYEQLKLLAQSSGVGSQDKKIASIAYLLTHVDSLSARYIARIPLDKLRLGFSDMTILDGLSWMISGDKSLRMELESVYNVRPDIGLLASMVRESGTKKLSAIHAHIGAPILAALCQRLSTADEMIKKMGMVAVEPKYDGVRVQIHYEGVKPKNQHATVQTFSRNLENTTAMFPEAQEVGKFVHAKEVILDSEAVGLNPATGALIPFQETMTRKRKHDISLFSENVPIKFMVFDILYKDGQDLLLLPLSERKKILHETLVVGSIFETSPMIVTEEVTAVRKYHDEQIKKGLEGVVVKKWGSRYEPGRRNYSWVKFKEEGRIGKLTDTIDGVVMGYYRGEGKRSGFGIGAFLVGVRNGEAFVTVTKIGTGVSDELWVTLRKRLNESKVTKKPKEYKDVNKIFEPDVWVEPKVVVELAGDDLTKSPTHGAGIAVRFPRLVRIREDKSPRDATTVQEVEDMYKNQGNSS